MRILIVILAALVAAPAQALPNRPDDPAPQVNCSRLANHKRNVEREAMAHLRRTPYFRRLRPSTQHLIGPTPQLLAFVGQLRADPDADYYSTVLESLSELNYSACTHTLLGRGGPT